MDVLLAGCRRQECTFAWKKGEKQAKRGRRVGVQAAKPSKYRSSEKEERREGRWDPQPAAERKGRRRKTSKRCAAAVTQCMMIEAFFLFWPALLSCKPGEL